METTNNIFSYKTIFEQMKAWRKLGTNDASLDFAKYDQPGSWYFRIFFYFYNGNADGYSSTYNTGLLAPTWENEITNWYEYPSAYAFLKMNGENERASKLKDFIELLSNISINSPWYFLSISGLDAALNRHFGENKALTINEERYSCTIKCPYESIDERIGTLLDLYRECAFSWYNKKEIIPSNLRKFDMGIYVFQTPIKTIHKMTSNSEYAHIGSGSQGYISNYKYFELHNCEIDPNSGRTWYSSMDNNSGFGDTTELQIKIYFDDIFEYRYNEFLAKAMGDLITLDIGSSYEDSEVTSDHDALTELQARLNYYNSTETFLEKTVNTITGAIKSTVSNKLKSIYLGNIYNISISNTIQDTNNLISSGNIFTLNTIKNDITYSNTYSNTSKNLGNIFTSNTLLTSIV